MKSSTLAFFRKEWLQLLLAILPLAAAIAVMPYAEHKVPMQWNLRGQVTWYAPKEWGLLLTPGLMLLVMALLLWLEKRDPARIKDAEGNLTAHGKATRVIRLAVSLVMAAITIIQISASLGYRADFGRWVITGTALLLAFVGNFFGKLKPNRYVGIRVPWTLNAEHVWRQTHRFAGWIWTSSSLVMAALCWMLPIAVVYQKVMWIWFFFLVIVPLLAAGYEARKERTAKAG